MTKHMETEVRVELKYCESCGGLRVRPMGSGLVYCSSCAAQHAEEGIPLLALPGPRRRPRLPSGVIRDLHGCVGASVLAKSLPEARA